MCAWASVRKCYRELSKIYIGIIVCSIWNNEDALVVGKKHVDEIGNLLCTPTLSFLFSYLSVTHNLLPLLFRQSLFAFSFLLRQSHGQNSVRKNSENRCRGFPSDSGDLAKKLHKKRPTDSKKEETYESYTSEMAACTHAGTISFLLIEYFGIWHLPCAVICHL